MKKTAILWLAFGLLGTSVHAQTFTMVDTARTTYGSTADLSLTNPVQIVNHTSDSLPMAWDRYDVVMPNGWDISSCTPIACQPIGISSGTYSLDTVNSLSDYHNCHFYPNGIAGNGVAKMRIWNTTTMEEHFVNWYVQVGIDGIGNVIQNNIVTFPNPGREITIQGDFDLLDGVDVRVVDASGKVVRQFQSVGETQIRINDLVPGCYFVHLSADTQLNYTQKVIVTH